MDGSMSRRRKSYPLLLFPCPVTFSNSPPLSRTHAISEIEDCAIAVEARYYLQLFLDTAPFHEPLLPALGGLTGIQKHIETDLDRWKAHRIIPFFIFDGQAITGQDEISLARGRRANDKTDQAWELYFNGRAEDAVSAFGGNSGTFAPILFLTLVWMTATYMVLTIYSWQVPSALNLSTPFFRRF